MIPSAPAYDARMSMAWLRALAVIVAVAGALLLLASGAGVRLGLWTYGTGFALLRYAAYTGIAAAALALVALFLPQGRARWIVDPTAFLRIALGIPGAGATHGAGVRLLDEPGAVQCRHAGVAEEQRRKRGRQAGGQALGITPLAPWIAAPVSSSCARSCSSTPSLISAGSSGMSASGRRDLM